MLLLWSKLFLNKFRGSRDIRKIIIAHYFPKYIVKDWRNRWHRARDIRCFHFYPCNPFFYHEDEKGILSCVATNCRIPHFFQSSITPIIISKTFFLILNNLKLVAFHSAWKKVAENGAKLFERKRRWSIARVLMNSDPPWTFDYLLPSARFDVRSLLEKYWYFKNIFCV